MWYFGVMSFFELIKSRHSVRAYKNKKVSSNLIDKILSSAFLAPSAGDLQSYKIFIIQDKNKKLQLAEAAHGQNFVSDAPVDFVFCADPQNSEKEYGSRGRDLYCIQDSTIACAYAQLAAHFLGLSSVWVGSFDQNKVSKIIKSTTLVPVAILVVGYPDEEPTQTPRRPPSELVTYL